MCCVPEQQPQDRAPSKEGRETIPSTEDIGGQANRFTQMPRVQGWKYGLLFVDTFSGWVDTYPTRTEKSSELAKALLKERIPRLGLPGSIQSDNGPAFVSEITQKVSEFLGIKWQLHTAWRPQASGKVEKMNHTLEENIAKLCQEAHFHWDRALPIALLRIRVAPQSGIHLSLYEIVCRRPFQAMIGLGDRYIDQEVKVKKMYNI